MKVSEKLGPCTTETPSASVPLGKPIQSAASTPAQLTRSCSVASAAPPSTEVIGPKTQVGEPGQQVAEDQREEDRDARPEARAAPRPRTTMNAAVSRAIHWSCGQ